MTDARSRAEIQAQYESLSAAAMQQRAMMNQLRAAEDWFRFAGASGAALASLCGAVASPGPAPKPQPKGRHCRIEECREPYGLPEYDGYCPTHYANWQSWVTR